MIGAYRSFALTLTASGATRMRRREPLRTVGAGGEPQAKGVRVSRWSIALVGMVAVAAFALVSSLGVAATWASPVTTRVIDGCAIRPDTPPSGGLCNLRGAHLAKINFAGANLAGADFADANLAGAILANANLAGANLSRTDLAGANLTGANLAGADLTRADLAGALANQVAIANVTWNNTICPDFSDSTGDGGSCNTATAATGASAAPGTATAPGNLDGSSISGPLDTGASTNLNASVIGGAAALAFTGFPIAWVALIGAVLVSLGLLLLFLPVSAKS
jgi:hypothetical protein